MGTINTKFNIEDNVYCISDNKILRGTIKKIFVHSTLENTLIDYHIKIGNAPTINRHEDETYSSIDDLTAAIQ